MNEKLKLLEQKLQESAVEVLERRVNRLQKRKFVLFPYLRVKWLLRKVRYAKGCASGCKCKN